MESANETALWPIRVRPFLDELLTSWLVRLAAAYGLKTYSFFTLMFGQGFQIWTRDFDRSAPVQFLDRLAKYTGVPVNQVLGSTLQSYRGIVAEHYNANGSSKWILPVGVYHRTRRRYGLQYCPLCLATDRVPYYRRRWRLAFHTVCDRHGTLMRDRCPACGSPIVFHRHGVLDVKENGVPPVRRCYSCGFDIARASAEDPPAGDLQPLIHLRTLCTFHDMGWIFCGDEVFHYEHLFLDVLHRLCEFLPSRQGRRLLSIAAEDSRLPAIDLRQGVKEFEQRPLVDRHMLLLAALWLLLNWPDRFIGCCTMAGVTMSRIDGDRVMPWWFRCVLVEKLNRSHYVPSSEEARAAASYLKTSGRRVSGISVGSLVGRDKKVAKAYREHPTYPWPKTDAEFAEALGKLNEKIRTLEADSPRRLVAERDRVILLVMQATGWHPCRVLRLKTSDFGRLPGTRRPEEMLPPKVCGVLMNYMRKTRRKLVGPASGNDMFIGWQSKGITRNNLAAKREFHRPAAGHHA